MDLDVTRTYSVVVNAEDQYSIWPVDRPLPEGWWLASPGGSKAECLTIIEQIWKDMRPLSERIQMDGHGPWANVEARLRVLRDASEGS